MPIKIVCAWCGKAMGEREGEYQMHVAGGKLVQPVSHGICESCQAAHFPGHPRRIDQTTQPRISE